MTSEGVNPSLNVRRCLIGDNSAKRSSVQGSGLAGESPPLTQPPRMATDVRLQTDENRVEAGHFGDVVTDFPESLGLTAPTGRNPRCDGIPTTAPGGFGVPTDRMRIDRRRRPEG